MSMDTWASPPGQRVVTDRLSVDPVRALPALHAGWLYTLTGVRNPAPEPRATCADCVMCAGAERSGSTFRMSPDVKCCSYVPHLTNFVAGRALAGPGGGTVRDRIARRAGVTPLGLGLSPDDLRRMVEDRSGGGSDGATDGAGGAAADVVRCPHFDAGTQGCSIWDTRNAVCSTWFCQHERGEVGQRFWHAVRDLLIAVEERLAARCLDRAGLPAGQARAALEHRAAIRAAVADANAGRPFEVDPAHEGSPDAYERLWGPWAGREEEWFARCAQEADAVSDAELRALAGQDAGLLDEVGARLAALDHRDLPAALRIAPRPGSGIDDDVLRLVGYSPFDPVLLPVADLQALELLDGRPVADVLAATDLDEDVLGRLHDFGVAVEHP